MAGEKCNQQVARPRHFSAWEESQIEEEERHLDRNKGKNVENFRGKVELLLYQSQSVQQVGERSDPQEHREIMRRQSLDMSSIAVFNH